MGNLHAVTSFEAAFFPQGETLLYPESMLFIDDGQAKPVELHCILKQGVCADNDLCAAIGQRRVGFPAGFHPQAARQPVHVDTEWCQPVTKVVAVLFGKQFCGCH